MFGVLLGGLFGLQGTVSAVVHESLGQGSE